MVQMPFDPVKLAGETEKIVCRDGDKKYYRFRPAKFYGGVSTADCVGCNLRCHFCWAWNVVTKPDKAGEFYSPQQVADKITAIAKRGGFSQARVSGNEPTIGKNHLVEVLESLPKNLRFILETNGILVGHDNDYATELARYQNAHVRVCLKGSNAGEFSRLTGAEAGAFELQLRALKNLADAGASFHPAVMASFSPKENLEHLVARLEDIRPGLGSELEYEVVEDYGGAFARLEKAGLARLR